MLKKSLKQPYVATIVIATTALAIYMLLHGTPGVEKASFLLAMAISALLVSKASVSMRSDAPNTALLQFICGLFIFALALTFTKTAEYENMVVEGVALQLAGQIGVFLDTAIDRSNRLRGINGGEKDD